MYSARHRRGRTLSRTTSLVAVVAAAPLAVAVPGVPAYAAASTAVVQVRFPTSMIGSGYRVLGPLNTDTMSRPSVATGQVGSGPVTFTVTAADAARGYSGFEVIAARWVDATHAEVSRADVALAPSQVDGSVVAVSASEPIPTTAWHSAEELFAAKPTTVVVTSVATPGTSAVTSRLAGRAVPQASALTDSRVAVPMTPPIPIINTNEIPTTVPLPQETIDGLVEEARDKGNSPVVSHNAYPGIQALRGTSVHPIGTTSHFEVKSSSQQVWQIGISYDGGPFKVTGTAAHDNTTSQTDTWPDRPDCYYPPGLGDSGNCATYNGVGALETYGRDQWYVDDEIAEVINWTDGSAIYLRDDKVYNDTYIGGTEWGLGDDQTNWYHYPPSIRSGGYGAWAPYLPGASTTVSLQDSYEYSVGAQVAIPGGPTFTSTMKQNHTYGVTNVVNFRHTSEVGVFKWYRYDMGHSTFQREFWSCELAQGWTKEPGTPEHPENPCWLYTG